VTREAGLQYTVEFSMYQVEKLLGLHRKLREEDSWLAKQATILGEKHLDPYYGTGSRHDRPESLADWLKAKKAHQSFQK
jgi:hypothetical protein